MSENLSPISSIPILDYNLIKNGQRDKFLAQLRYAFVVVGFAYLKDPPIDKDLTASLIDYTPKLFDIPQEVKDAAGMITSPHFLGYTRPEAEYTRGAIDIREQYDLGTDYTNNWKPGDPDYLRYWGNSPWPAEDAVPGFKATMIRYLSEVGTFGFEFVELLAEALYLPPNAFDEFYDRDKATMQHRGKVVKYPVLDPAKGNQGVGPHYDSGFLTLLLQASPQPGLQVQLPSGAWVEAKPMPNTLVVNLGKGIEAVTHGVAKATCHRVFSPDPSEGPRYSVPYFQMISQTVYLHGLDAFKEENLHPEIRRLIELRGSITEADAVNYAEYGREIAGHVALIGRVRSHRDVGEKWYPALYRGGAVKRPESLATLACGVSPSAFK